MDKELRSDLIKAGLELVAKIVGMIMNANGNEDQIIAAMNDASIALDVAEAKALRSMDARDADTQAAIDAALERTKAE